LIRSLKECVYLATKKQNVNNNIQANDWHFICEEKEKAERDREREGERKEGRKEGAIGECVCVCERERETEIEM